MSISIDKIDLIMERAQVGYAAARDVLQKFDGNVVESLIYLEGSQQTRNYHEQVAAAKAPRVSFWCKLKKSLNRLHQTHFVLTKNKNTVLDLPLTVAGLLVMITLPFSFFLLLIAMVSGHRMTIRKPNGQKVRMQEAVQFVDKQSQKVREAIKVEEAEL